MNDSQLLGMVGGMVDGMISGFEYRGITVNRHGNSIAVSPEGHPRDSVGGRLLIESATLEGAKEWIDAKADYYGDNE